MKELNGRQGALLCVGGALVCLFLAGARQSTPPAERVDLLLHHGKIVTVDDAFSIQQAVAVRDGRIVAVGGNELTRRFQAAKTIDLKGKTVIPGFNDSHIHIQGNAKRYVDLTGLKSIEELKQRVSAMARRLGDGEWITGYGWSEDEVAEKRRPLRADLDAAAPRNPVILTRAGGHSGVANSLALRLAGITRSTPDPEGGVIEHDERGELNGVIRERHSRVARLAPAATADELRESFTQNLRDLLKLGITSLIQAGETPEDYASWERVYRQYGAELPRAAVQIRWVGKQRMQAFGRKTGAGDDRLRVGAVKVLVDGGFTGPAAYTSKPYKGQPGYRGKLNLREDELRTLVKDAHELGWQMGFHTIGDAAIELAVDCFAEALKASPRADHRHYLNHFTVIPSAATMDRVAANKILITQQANFTYTLEGRYVDNLEDERLQLNNPLRTPMSHGIFMALSSDILPIGPMVGLYAAVTRKGMSGAVYGAGERLSVAEALRGYTRNGAYLTFEEKSKGTIEPGRLADLVVLAEDLLTVPPDRIKDLVVEKTFVGGRLLYDRAAGK